MNKFGNSQTTTRFEDNRLLTGRGQYIDDTVPAGALFGFVFRSPVAHGQITTLDVEAARAAPGVHMVLTARDALDMGAELNMPGTLNTNRDGTKGAAPMRPFLAVDRVRHVGEPIALIVADTLAQAKDAAELIEFDYDDLDVSLSLNPGGPTIHPEAPGNVAYDFALGDEEAVNAAFARAAHVVKARIDDHRIIVNALEPRGAFAEWDGKRLHLSFGGQGVWAIKAALAMHLKMDPEDIRVTTNDVGGGFGMKASPYPEFFSVALAARALGRPVRWMSDRTEAMLSDYGGRALVSDAALAFDKDFKIIGYRVENLSDLGAYNSGYGQMIQSYLFSMVLTGTYDIQDAFLGVKGVYTNTNPTSAYRGAGRPEAIYTLERMMDYAARQLGVSPWELRRRNFIAGDAFPYRTVSDQLYDVGDFHRVVATLEKTADVEGFAARKAASAERGKLRGIGLSYYVESILGDPTEGAKIEFRDDGGVNLYVGTQSNGQGHETVYAQFLSDRTGIPVDRITIVQGDSDRIERGGGTGGSRSVTTQANTTLVTVEQMVAAFTPFVAEQLGVTPEAVSFDEGSFRADGSNQTPSLLEAAEMARAQDRADLLVHQARYALPGRSYPNGGHVAEVEVDPETGETQVVKYTVTDDFGNLVHPMLVEGQVHGGIAQGIGQAICERAVFDDEGQLLTATFMDYAMPRATDMPPVIFTTEPVPSTANPLGMKGCGEAGTVGALAAVANAALDAMWDEGVRVADMPFTPSRVWAMLNEAKGGAD